MVNKFLLCSIAISLIWMLVLMSPDSVLAQEEDPSAVEQVAEDPAVIEQIAEDPLPDPAADVAAVEDNPEPDPAAAIDPVKDSQPPDGEQQLESLDGLSDGEVTDIYLNKPWLLPSEMTEAEWGKVRDLVHSLQEANAGS